MLGGENVGTAYVRILADGSGLDKSIRDEFKDSADTFDQIGNRDSKAYKQAFADEMGNKTDKNSLDNALIGALARGDVLDKFLKSNNWTRFRAGLKRQFGEVGELTGKRLEEGLVEGMTFDQLEGRINNLTREVAQSTREIMKEENRIRAEQARLGNELAASIHKETLEQRLELDREFEESVTRLHAEAMKDREDQDREFMANHNRLAAQAAEREKRFMADLNEAYRINAQLKRQDRNQIEETQRRYKDLIFLIDRMNQGLKVDVKRHDLRLELDALSDSMTRLGLRTKEVHFALRDHERDLFLMHPTVNKVNRVIDDFSDTFGRAFGKGSRNDFLNFIGTVAGGSTRLLKLIPAVSTSLFDFVQRARLAGRLGERGGFFGSMALDVTKLAGAISGGLLVAFGLVGPMISILSQLAGVVVALASNLSFTLVGAAGSAAGALLPLVAGLGVAAAGFANLEGDAKKAAKGIITEFKGLGEAAAEGLTSSRRVGGDNLFFDTRSFEQQMNFIRGMVSDLRPLTREIGSSMGYALDIFIERIGEANGPWEQFIDSMTGSRGIGWLGVNSRIAFRSITEGLGGMLGLLRGLQPAANTFLEWMRDITIRFSNFTNSAAGQNQIMVFMENALESTRDFGTFLDATWDILREFLNAGRTTGDSLFVSMAAQLDEWTAALQRDPQILQRWFHDAEEFAEALGHMVIGIGKVVDALDNEWSRSLATGALELFSAGVELIGDSLRAIADILGISENKVFSFGGQVAAAALILPRLSNALLGTRGSFTGFIGNMRSAETRMAAMRSAAGGLAGAAGLGLLIGSTQVADARLSTLMSTAGGAAAGFAVGGPVGAAIGGFGGLILGLARNAGKGAGSARRLYDELGRVDPVKAAKASLQDLVGTLDQVTGATTAATRASALKRLEDTGMIEAANQFGISARTVVNAALGQKGAMEQLTPAIGKAELAVRKLTTKEEDLVRQRDSLIDSASINDSERQVLARTREIEAIDETLVALRKDKNERLANLNVLKQMPGQLRAQGRELRRTAAATADYTGLLKGIPPRIRSKIETDGIIPSVKGVAKVAEKYDLVDRKSIKTLIEASGTDATVKDVLKVITTNERLDKQRPNPKISADKSALDRIVSTANSVLSNIGSRVVTPRINVSTNAQTAAQATASWLNSIDDETVYINAMRRGGRAPITAAGGLFNNDTIRRIAEAGPEAVVPLDRPLGMVDPSVRWLSAIAQGKQMASGGVVGSSRTVNADITVVSNSEDPRAVAVETLNALVASSY